jgi:hypothetical protein
VYWHNRCSTKHKLIIKYKKGSIPYTFTYTAIVGHVHSTGHKKLPATYMLSIKDGGRTR